MTSRLTELYKDTVAAYPVLSKEDETRLGTIILNGDEDDPEVREAVQSFVLHNQRLVILIAKKYERSFPKVALEELIQEGNLGLIRAAEKFNPTFGWKFSTYATYWISQSIVKSSLFQSRMIRLPPKVEGKVNKLTQLINQLTEELQRAPTLDEICDFSDMDPELVQKLLSVPVVDTSLDQPTGDEDGRTVGDVLLLPSDMTPEDLAIQSANRDLLNTLLETLSEKECFVLTSYMGYGVSPKSFSQIGEEMNLTSERARQIKNQAMTKLRREAKKVLRGQQP